MLPLQHPLRIAEDAALIDELSHGRFSLAVGRGWQLPEFGAFQIDQTASRGMFAEAMEIIQRRGLKISFLSKVITGHSKTFQCSLSQSRSHSHPIYQTVVTPGPYKRAGSQCLPIIRSLNFVSIDTVEVGTKLYKTELQKNGKQLSDIDLPLSVKIHVDDSDEEAEKDAAPNAQWFYSALSQFLPGSPGRARPSNGYEEYPDTPEKVAELADDDPWVWCACYGSPETVLKSMQAYSERVYTNHWVTWMRIGQLPHEKVMRSMELFTKEVMPKLKANG